MRKEFVMSDEDLKKLYEASKPVPYILIGGIAPKSPQEYANMVWRELGKKMGFDYLTVKPVPGKGDKHFTAELNH